MSDKDLRSQLEGLFSDIVSEEEGREAELPPEEIAAEPAEIEAQLIAPEVPPGAGVEPEQVGPAEEREAPPPPAPPAKPAPRLRVRRSIRLRLLALLLGLTIVSVVAATYLGVSSIQRVGQSAQQTSSEALRVQAEEYLRQLTIGHAQRNDLILKKVQLDAENVARYAASIFEKPSAFARGTYWRAEDHMFVGPEGQYINDENDVCSVFVPNFVDINDELLTALELSAYLDFIFRPTYDGDPNTVAIYLSTEKEMTRYYPNINLGNILPPDFQVTRRPWYVSSTPENNPERKVVWSPVYEDATGKGLMVTAAAPVYTGQGEFVGGVGIDVTLKDISANVEATRLLGGGYSFLIDDTGHALALPEQGYQDILGRPPEPGEFGTDLSQVETEFASVLAKMTAGSTGFEALETNGKELFIAYAPLESTGWSLANVIEAEKVLQAVTVLRQELDASTRALLLTRILPVGGVVFIIVTALGILLANRLIDPIQKLAAAAQQIGTGRWDAPLPRAGDDEIGVLSQAFATMTVQLRESMEATEQRVAERTRELEHRAMQLTTATEISRVATSVLDPDELMQRAVNLVRERFDLYYAALFLIDESGQWAVLKAGTGEAGRQMLEQDHRLEVGGTSMVGWCTAHAQARIALDIGKEAVRFDNPLLPDTRSEMALPLISRGRVIGALDVQSTEREAFSQEDIAVLQTMADQVAVAIDNARLFAETQAALEELEATHRLYLRGQWAEFASTLRAPSYERTQPGVPPLGDTIPPEVEQAITRREVVVQSNTDGAEQAALVAPISLRGEVIGALGLHETGNKRQWTDDEIALIEAVAEQMALALENARLFEQTQRSAARERLIREITARVRSAVDIESILQTTVQEVSKALGVSRGLVRLGTEAELATPPTERGADSGVKQ